MEGEGRWVALWAASLAEPWACQGRNRPRSSGRKVVWGVSKDGRCRAGAQVADQGMRMASARVAGHMGQFLHVGLLHPKLSPSNSLSLFLSLSLCFSFSSLSLSLFSFSLFLHTSLFLPISLSLHLPLFLAPAALFPSPLRSPSRLSLHDHLGSRRGGEWAMVGAADRMA